MNEKIGPYSINSIVCDDCLNVLAQLPNECIDLIYVDPPFFSQANYKSRNSEEAFVDKWPSLDEYLDWLVERIIPMRRVLKETGSIYVHLDWHAVHYVKVRMDEIFGYNNFLNEVIWYYRTGGSARRWFNRRHDVLLLYRKGRTHFYDGLALKDMRTKDEGSFSGYFGTDENGRRYREARASNKTYRYYLDEPKNPDDVWIVPPIPHRSLTERTGYPTQKPEKLLERVIKASSRENDIVADFFCGSGTTLAVAAKLNRKWFGCDVNLEAIEITRKRIEKDRMARSLF